MTRARLGLLIALLAVVVGCGATIPPIRSEGERLTVARKLMADRQYLHASELLKTYIANNAGSGDVDEALYLLGECYLRGKQYASAQLEFERLLRDYPESDSSASASFRLGESMFGQTRPADFDQDYTLKALAQWQNYLRDHPDHWLRPEAERRIAETRLRLAKKLVDTAKLYMKLKLPTPARSYFERVVDEYSDTPILGEAWIGLALCDAMSGRQAEAVERLKEIETRFAGQPLGNRAARERSRIQR